MMPLELSLAWFGLETRGPGGQALLPEGGKLPFPGIFFPSVGSIEHSFSHRLVGKAFVLKCASGVWVGAVIIL